MPMPSAPMPMREGESPMPMGQGMGAPPPAAPDAEAAPQGEGEDEPNVSPEEQALYHQFMENYYTVMYVGEKGQNGKQQPPLADDIRTEYFSGDLEPVDALANAGVALVKNFADSAANAGKQIPGDVLMHAGIEVMEDLAELAEKAKFHEFTQEEMDVSLYKAMDTYQQVAGDTLNKEELKNDYDAMVAADKEGRLDEVLPGASDAAKRMPKPEPAAAGPPAAPAEPMPVAGPQQGMGRA